MSTKKTVDTEIVEDVEKIEPEVIEEVKEIVPEVKSHLRGISTPSMIHTHLDNFLAKLCGETPIDDKVRNSLEYWINELAEGNGGSTKKIYCHPIQMVLTNNDIIMCLIFNNDSTAFVKNQFIQWFSDLRAEIGTVRVMVSGSITADQDNNPYPASQMYADSSYPLRIYSGKVSLFKNYSSLTAFSNDITYFTDNVNPIN